jgi:energy-coupling factor transporter ATP-binding protein EcfA2
MTDRRSGFVVFLTGLSASGKSTLAHGLQQALIPVAGRPVTVLEGDVLRRQVSAELSFSPGDRRVHLERVTRTRPGGRHRVVLSRDGVFRAARAPRRPSAVISFRSPDLGRDG